MVGVKDEEMRTLIEDIRKFLRDDLEEFENNQWALGIDHLFQDFSIKASKGTGFSGYKYIAYNIIEN